MILSIPHEEGAIIMLSVQERKLKISLWNLLMITH